MGKLRNLLRTVLAAGVIGMLGSAPSARAEEDFDAATLTHPDEDFDGDGLTNQQELYYGTDPRKDIGSDSDHDGTPDGQDGWALDKQLHPPRLPDTRYAVIDLGADFGGYGLNDACEVLGNYKVWKKGEITALPFDIDGIRYHWWSQISADGVVVGGRAGDSADYDGVFTWKDGALTQLVHSNIQFPGENFENYNGSATPIISSSGIYTYLYHSAVERSSTSIEESGDTKEGIFKWSTASSTPAAFGPSANYHWNIDDHNNSSDSYSPDPAIYITTPWSMGPTGIMTGYASYRTAADDPDIPDDAYGPAILENGVITHLSDIGDISGLDFAQFKVNDSLMDPWIFVCGNAYNFNSANVPLSILAKRPDWTLAYDGGAATEPLARENFKIQAIYSFAMNARGEIAGLFSAVRKTNLGSMHLDDNRNGGLIHNGIPVDLSERSSLYSGATATAINSVGCIVADGRYLLVPAELQFQNPRMGTKWAKLDSVTPGGKALHLGVMTNQRNTIKFRLFLGENDQVIKDEDVEWSGAASGTGKQTEVTFSTAQNVEVIVKIKGVEAFRGSIWANIVSGPTQAEWEADTDNWIHGPGIIIAEAFANDQFNHGHNDSWDARKHMAVSAYISCLEGVIVAKEVMDSHEVTNLLEDDPENESVMDLYNNAKGRLLWNGIDPSTFRAHLTDQVNAASNSGELIYVDGASPADGHNGQGMGLLRSTP